MDLWLATFVGFIVDMDAQYNLRILGPRLFPLALNDLPFLGLCERSLHGLSPSRRTSPGTPNMPYRGLFDYEERTKLRHQQPNSGLQICARILIRGPP
jgi:hypothetical protein